MKVDQFSKLTGVRIVEDERGYYLEGIKSGERLNMSFKTARDALYYATQAYLIMNIEDKQWTH